MNRRPGLLLVPLALCAIVAGVPGDVPLAAADSAARVPGFVASVASEGPPLELRLRLETRAAGRFVRVRDLVEVRSDRDGTFEAVAGTVVRVRDGRFVRRVDVARRLKRAGLAEGSFRITGPALCDWRPCAGVPAEGEAGR